MAYVQDFFNMSYPPCLCVDVISWWYFYACKFIHIRNAKKKKMYEIFTIIFNHVSLFVWFSLCMCARAMQHIFSMNSWQPAKCSKSSFFFLCSRDFKGERTYIPKILFGETDRQRLTDRQIEIVFLDSYIFHFSSFLFLLFLLLFLLV